MAPLQITTAQLKKMAIAYLMILNIKQVNKGNQVRESYILEETIETEALLQMIDLKLPICISND